MIAWITVGAMLAIAFSVVTGYPVTSGSWIFFACLSGCFGIAYLMRIYERNWLMEEKIK